MKQKQSHVIERGDGWFSYITCIARPSANEKTGAMAQVAMVVDDTPPPQAIKEGKDSVVCKGCALRGSMCYVNPITLSSTWKKHHKDSPEVVPKHNRNIRFGQYGNPSLLSEKVIRSTIASGKGGWTGYFHDWWLMDDDEAKKYGKYFMASIDDVTAQSHGTTAKKMVERAKSLGLRYFRVNTKYSNVEEPNERTCPNVTHGVKCDDCLLCSGTEGRGKVDITIDVHGSPVGMGVMDKLLQLERG